MQFTQLKRCSAAQRRGRSRRAQHAAMPVIGYIGFGALENSILYLAAFR